VITATNKNLRDEITARNFREDLYHRISTIIIEVPPLSARTGDIPLLAARFMEDACTAMGKTTLTIEPEALDRLSQLPWTGNIRELKNVVERLAILCDNPITPEDIVKYT
jgi:transcriptional regulator with GAF, ATPase, and Fis domain